MLQCTIWIIHNYIELFASFWSHLFYSQNVLLSNCFLCITAWLTIIHHHNNNTNDVKSILLLLAYAIKIHSCQLLVGQSGNSSVISRVKLRQSTIPFSLVRGQDSTMWDIVWVSPQGHRLSGEIHYESITSMPTTRTAHNTTYCSEVSHLPSAFSRSDSVDSSFRVTYNTPITDAAHTRYKQKLRHKME